MTKNTWRCVPYTSACVVLVIILTACTKKSIEQAPFHGQIVFPYQSEHVHGSTIVELPNGDILTAWFQGSGERWADDVRIMGSRLIKGDTTWSAPFVMADVDGFPDINPILFMDHSKRLWMMWYPVLANQWETSIPMYRLSEDYNSPGAPKWNWQDVLFVKVGDKTERGIQPNDKFVKQVDEQLRDYEAYLNSTLKQSMGDSAWKALLPEWNRYKVKMDSLSRGQNMVRGGKLKTNTGWDESSGLGYPLTRRIGWQTKNKAVFSGERMIVPLYSDGFDCTLFALTDDGGKTWTYSNPVLGGAGIQATIVRAADGTLSAYLRDNGPPPSRMQRTDSHDNGVTWSIPKDDLLPNPGAGFDAVTLPNGEWLMVFNDTEYERFNLSVAISDDAGKTWKWKKAIENDTRNEKQTSSHYPSVVVGADGRIHVSYSYHRDDVTPGKTVKYVTFTTDWVKNQ
ncbi:exo-alpha-sialidase [Chryseolinea sp. T2]|uniref:sialidase family protein n=1 Tax=Chryseolinea sp. T2 TaxID=3129255 RepID=UPI003077DF5B